MFFRPSFLTYVNIIYFAAACNYSENYHKSTYKNLKPCKDIIWNEIHVYIATFSVLGIPVSALGPCSFFLLPGLLVLYLFITSTGRQEWVGKGN